MARGKPYTSEQREYAVDLACEIGLDEALVQFQEREGRELKRSTLRKWLSLAGKADDITEQRQKAIDAHVQEFEMRREALKVKILDVAEDFLNDMRAAFTRHVVDQKGGEHEFSELPDPSERAKLATGFGIMFDKLQLATGGSTMNQTVHNPSLKALVDAQREQNETTKAGLIAAATEGTD